MSIASELSALNGYILGAYDEINDKGGTVPQNKNMANLATAIASISGGGGGGSTIATGEISYPSSLNLGSWPNYKLEHNLGAEPQGILWMLKDVGNKSQISAIGEGAFAFYADSTQTVMICNHQSQAFPYLCLDATTSHTISNLFFNDLPHSQAIMLVQSTWNTSLQRVPAGTTMRWFVW